MDAAQWPQQGLIGLVESNERQTQIQGERRARPHKEHAINCPRCDSTNTKFCYYNNYSLSQPRYFCKTCRRYWTAGGTLRNVPVGGGSRKNKRSSSSTSTSSSNPTLPLSTPTATKTATPLPPSSTNPHPSHDLMHLAYKLYHGGHDLNLSFPGRTFGGSCFLSADGPGQFAPEPLSPVPGSLLGAGLGFQELMKPPASGMKMQPLNGVVGDGDGRLLFPFQDLKHATMISETDQAAVEGQHGDPTFFWNGVMGNGGAGNGGAW